MRVIGLYSPRPQSGKSTLADEVELYTTCGASHMSAFRYNFAGPLKRIAHQVIAELRPELEHEDVSAYLYGDAKDTDVIPGITGRDIMVQTGTHLGRGTFGENVWTDALARRLEAMKDKEALIVVDDVRFLNEYNLLREYGALMVKVIRPDAAPYGAMEGLLEGCQFDMAIINDGTKEQYICAIRALLINGKFGSL